jgi:hypothetical protein
MTSQELEDKVRAYKELSNQIAELEEKRKILGTEILQMLSKETKTFLVAGYRVQRFERLSIKISLDDARMLGATKNEEVINKDEIKRLHQLGHSIPNVQLKESLIVYTPK